MSARIDQLTALLQPSVEALGCELWGIEYQAQGRGGVLRVFIETATGVTIDDCERVSRQLSSVLDVEDPITGEYTLEVSSPGADRSLFTLAQFRQFVGHQVSIRLRAPFDGRRNFKGLLRAVENEDVVVVVDADEYLLPINSIEKANIVPQF
ncbi:ribosome maturation factor RimP [Halioxenophilus sp. WMMB6]|uniref:ribosome maturation factor RimP n=1 Tax=Halioxenophilus sp. WMMB6 TaxID=3073815 RepID=UPI00295E5D29|nr:ribosome maturation factor RimP [Halioxenophilus sp. WMMB6]